MHGLKALSLANAFVPEHQPAVRMRARRRASWARNLAAAARRVAPPGPAPRVRAPRPLA